MTALWIAVAVLFAWMLWNEWQDSKFSTTLRQHGQRLSDNDKDIISLAKAVSRLENPVQHALSDHLSGKKPLTVKKPRRKSPPRR